MFRLKRYLKVGGDNSGFSLEDNLITPGNKMQPSHLKELEILESEYWWHVSKRKLAMTLLKRFAPKTGLLVEGGIGASGNLQAFQEMGWNVQGFDIMPTAIEMAQSKGVKSVQVHDLQEPWPVKEPAQAIVLLDVLEHIENPVQALEHMKAALAQEGVIILTVPAMPILTSSWDEKLGHYRRYTSALFRKHVNQAGLHLKWMRHWNSFSVPPALLLRGIGRILNRESTTEFPRVPRLVNSMLIGLANVERQLMKLAMPIGLSLCGVVTHD